MEVFHIDNASVNKVHDPLTMEPSKLHKTGCTWNLKILTTNHKLLQNPKPQTHFFPADTQITKFSGLHKLSCQCLGLTEKKETMCKFYCKFCDFGTKELNNEQWRTLKSINQEQKELYTKKNIWFGLLGINSLTKNQRNMCLKTDCYIQHVYITYVYI